MILWCYNLNAPWPMDPAEGEKLNEMMFAAIDDCLKTGEVLEFGFFPDGMGGMQSVVVPKMCSSYRRRLGPSF
jgi:hypothetical protein